MLPVCLHMSHSLLVWPLSQSFLDTARAHSPFTAGPLPDLGLSVADKCRIRDRSTIMARQLYAEHGQGFADQQVSHDLGFSVQGLGSRVLNAE